MRCMEQTSKHIIANGGLMLIYHGRICEKNTLNISHQLSTYKAIYRWLELISNWW